MNMNVVMFSCFNLSLPQPLLISQHLAINLSCKFSVLFLGIYPWLPIYILVLLMFSFNFYKYWNMIISIIQSSLLSQSYLPLWTFLLRKFLFGWVYISDFDKIILLSIYAIEESESINRWILIKRLYIFWRILDKVSCMFFIR